MCCVAISFAGAPKIVITELFRDPSGAETALGGGLSHEFVEVTNVSPDTLILNNVWLTDGAEADSVVQWLSPLTGCDSCIYGTNRLLPSQSALILDRDYEAAVYANRSSAFAIPSNTLILTVNDNDIGNGLQSDDGILLYKGTSSRIDTVLFCAADSVWTENVVPDTKLKCTLPANKEGVSIAVKSFLFDKVEFSICERGVSPGIFDLAKGNVFTEWKITETDSLTNRYTVRLAASDSKYRFTVNWSMTAGGMVVYQSVVSGVNGCFEIVADIGKNQGDIVLTVDNMYQWLVDCKSYATADNSIRITEMYPKSAAGETEWFELANNSAVNSYNLSGWTIGNKEEMTSLIETQFVLGAKELVVVCKDSAALKKQFPLFTRILQPKHWHTLSNSEDTLLIKTADSITADIVTYNSKSLKGWGYQSLDRIEKTGTPAIPTKWKINATPTPGVPSKKAIAQNSKMEIGPIPFTPNNDGKNDLLKVTFPQNGLSDIACTIYSFDGKKICELSDIQNGICYWDGKTAEGKVAPVGPFFVVAEATLDGKVKEFRNKGILWR